MQSQPVVSSDTGAVCPEHPDRQSTGTCLRCGRFVCPGCDLQEGSCWPCHRRQVLELPSAATRARFAMGMLWLRAGISLVQVVLNAWLFVRLEGGLPVSEDADIYDRINSLLIFPVLAGIFVTALFFLRWLHLAVRTANALGASQEKPGWAVFSWFIPLFNLVKPYRVMKELWVGLGAAQGSSLLASWWAAWILGGFMSRVDQGLSRQLETTPKMISSSLLASVLSEALALVAAVLCIQVIRALQARLDAHRAEAMNPS
ncbi:DUF4328 domain-containing protein [Pyxidicoccus sp. 3LG]